MNLSLCEIAKRVQGELEGQTDPEVRISALSSLEEVIPGSLVFADGEENYKKALASQAGVILVPMSATFHDRPIIKVAHPFTAFISLLEVFYPPRPVSPHIHPTAVIAECASIGKDVYIGPYTVVGEKSCIEDNCVIKSHVVIGNAVRIGQNSTIQAHVVIYDNSMIGKHVSIHAGSVIGSDGFGYVYQNGQHIKVPHVGKVVIEDNVEIGANTCIDRATIGKTQLGEGTKIDNLVQIAHSVRLGRNNIVCAFTGIAGSSISGDRVTFAANVGVSDHVYIEDEVILTARAGVPSRKRLYKGNVYLGNPARPRDKAIKLELEANRIPLLRKKVEALTEKVSALWKQFSKEDKAE